MIIKLTNVQCYYKTYITQFYILILIKVDKEI